jgi:hypothetical protein
MVESKASVSASIQPINMIEVTNFTLSELIYTIEGTIFLSRQALLNKEFQEFVEKSLKAVQDRIESFKAKVTS